MSRQNIKNEDKKTGKSVLVTITSLFFGIIIWVGLFNLLSILFLVYLDEPIRDIKEFMYTEEAGIEMAEKALQKKYGEEFIIHDVYSKSPGEFWAECSPVSNEEVVFQAAIWKDGSGVVYDEYIPSIVAKELENEIEGELQKYYDSVFVKVHASGMWGPFLEVDSVRDMSLKEYVKMSNPSRLWIDMGIDAEEGNKHLEEEYAFYESIQEMISNQEIPPLHVECYDMDAELQEWCDEFFTQNSDADGTYDSKVYWCDKMKFDCTAEGVSITYDEFKTMREELGKY